MVLPKEYWATQTWDFLFAQASIADTPYKRERFYDLFVAYLDMGTPCDECTQHLLTEIKRPELNLRRYCKSAEDLVKFLWRLKNIINRRLGKPMYPFANVYKRYFIDSEDCQSCSITPKQI